MSEKRGRGFGSRHWGGALGQLDRLTRLGRVMKRQGVGGLVRQVLSGQSPQAGDVADRPLDSGARGDTETSDQGAVEAASVREEELNREAEQLRKALEQAKLDLLGQTTKLKNDIFDLKKRNSELLEQVVQLTKRERDLAKQILDVKFQGSGHKADKKKLEIEVRDLKRALKEAEQKIEELRSSAGRLDAAVESDQDGGDTEGKGVHGAPGQADADRKTNRTDLRTVERLEDDLARLRLELKERDERVVDLEHRLEKAEMRLDDLRKSLGKRETAIRSLRKDNERLEKQLGALRSENQGLVRELDRLRRVTARTTEERRRLREVSRTSQIKTLQAAVSELQSAVLELRGVVDEGALSVAEPPSIDEETFGETKS